ncbi:MAG TPA: hypothetical protein VLX31_10005 [Streptosporangiaceae bacterium]|nr:hypothetical protein [Streptosporangiaceae bacterium]
MGRTTPAAAPAAVSTIILAAALAVGLACGPAPRALAAAWVRPALSGREVYKIVDRRPGPKQPVVTASGAFRSSGTYYPRSATLAFPRGRIIIARRPTRTSVSGPNLATCWFSIRQVGVFRVTKATGRFRGLRESGTYRTTISARYNRTGPRRCGDTITNYRATTYDTGTIG